MATTVFKFVLNTWQHLYSLQQAIQQTGHFTGNRLRVSGVIRNQGVFNNRDMPIELTFSPSDNPQYQKTADQQLIFGQLSGNDDLHADIQVNAAVFKELKQNLIEYMSIEGIHILVTIGLSYAETTWHPLATADIVQLDYAMKGDGGV